MIVLLGLVDIHATVLLLAMTLSIKIPISILIVTMGLLFAKACISITDIGSITDVAVIIILLISIFTAIPVGVLYAMAAIIGFKGLSSLAA